MQKTVLYLLFFTSIISYSQIKLLRDFNATADGTGGLDKSNVAIAGDYVYFTAISNYNEVWRTNGNIVQPILRNQSNSSRLRTSNPKWVITSNGGASQVNFIALRGSTTPTVSGTSLAYGCLLYTSPSPRDA